ncbi:MAG: 3-keto-5-aminohexanoate cleavage protein [Blautia faecis]
MLVFEDSHYLADGVDAEYNWQVVEKLVNLIRAMGLEPATPDEARQMLNLRKR